MTPRDKCFALAGGFMFMACDAVIRGRWGWVAVAVIMALMFVAVGTARGEQA